MGRNRSKSSRSGRPVCVCGLVSPYCAFRKKHAMAFNTGSLSGPPGFPPLPTVPVGAVSIPTAVGSGQAAAAFRPAGSFHGSDGTCVATNDAAAATWSEPGAVRGAGTYAGPPPRFLQGGLVTPRAGHAGPAAPHGTLASQKRLFFSRLPLVI